MRFIGRWHNRYVHARRVEVLAAVLSDLIPDGSRILDVGCGDGWLAALIAQLRPDVVIAGIDVLVRPQAKIPVEEFDGERIPRPDDSFDVVTMVDVLHHNDDPAILLEEASRVASRYLVIKDHILEGTLARPTLVFMDWVSNAQYGLSLPFNYWTRKQWMEALEMRRIDIDSWQDRLPLYRFPANLIFGRSLHFVARLRPRRCRTAVDRLPATEIDGGAR